MRHRIEFAPWIDDAISVEFVARCRFKSWRYTSRTLVSAKKGGKRIAHHGTPQIFGHTYGSYLFRLFVCNT